MAPPPMAPPLMTPLSWHPLSWHPLSWHPLSSHGTLSHGTPSHGIPLMAPSLMVPPLMAPPLLSWHPLSWHPLSWHPLSSHGTPSHGAPSHDPPLTPTHVPPPPPPPKRLLILALCIACSNRHEIKLSNGYPVVGITIECIPFFLPNHPDHLLCYHDHLVHSSSAAVSLSFLWLPSWGQASPPPAPPLAPPPAPPPALVPLSARCMLFWCASSTVISTATTFLLSLQTHLLGSQQSKTCECESFPWGHLWFYKRSADQHLCVFILY